MVSSCTGVLCGAPDYVLWALLVFTILSFAILDRMLARLEIYHKPLWRSLGSPDFRLKIGVPKNLISPFLITWFVWTAGVSRYGDPILIRFVWALRAMGVVIAALLFAGALVRGCE